VAGPIVHKKICLLAADHRSLATEFTGELSNG